MVVARRAGPNPASSATVSRNSIAAPSVAGSDGDSPNSCACTLRVVEGGAQADGHPGGGHHRDLAQHHPQNPATLGAERHPDADLAGAPCHGVGHYAVEADRREQGRQTAERDRQHRHHPFDEQRLADLRVHGLHVGNREVAVDPLHRLADADGGG